MQNGAPEYSATDLIALVDELIATYVSWRSACSAVRRSYDRWCTCDRRDTRTAFGVLAAALDREEQAATTYRRLVEQVTTLPVSAGMESWSARGIAQRLGL